MIDNWSIGINLYAWIRFHFKRDSRILQLGSGKIDSLLLLDYDLTSIEHDKKWIQKHCIHAPLKNGWYDINEVPNYDLLIIDGPPNKYRPGVINNLHLFNPDKTVIVDDVNRLNDMRVSKAVSEWASREIKIHKDNDKQFAVI